MRVVVAEGVGSRDDVVELASMESILVAAASASVPPSRRRVCRCANGVRIAAFVVWPLAFICDGENRLATSIALGTVALQSRGPRSYASALLAVVLGDGSPPDGVS